MSIRPTTIITVEIRYTPVDNDKIHQIKRLRAATNVGLKEAKEAVEAALSAWGGGTVFSMSAEKYGRLLAIVSDENGREGIALHRVSYDETDLIRL